MSCLVHTIDTALVDNSHLLSKHFCFFLPLPPNFGISKHILHLPQFCLVHPAQSHDETPLCFLVALPEVYKDMCKYVDTS